LTNDPSVISIMWYTPQAGCPVRLQGWWADWGWAEQIHRSMSQSE